jgi:hypothetical protein
MERIFTTPTQELEHNNNNLAGASVVVAVSMFLAANVNIMPAMAELVIVPNTDPTKFHLRGTEQEINDYLRNNPTLIKVTGIYERNGQTFLDIKRPVGGQGTNTPTNPTTIPNITNTNPNTNNNSLTNKVDSNQQQQQLNNQNQTTTNTANPVNNPNFSNSTTVNGAPINIDNSNRQRIINEAPSPLLGILGTQGLGINNFSTIQQLNTGQVAGCNINESGKIDVSRTVNGSVGGNRGYVDGGVNYNQWGNQEISASVRIGTTFGGSEGVVVNESVSKTVDCIPFNPAPVNNYYWSNQGYQQPYREEKKVEVETNEKPCECEDDGSKELKPQSIKPANKLEQLRSDSLIFTPKNEAIATNFVEQIYATAETN